MIVCAGRYSNLLKTATRMPVNGITAADYELVRDGRADIPTAVYNGGTYINLDLQKLIGGDGEDPLLPGWIYFLTSGVVAPLTRSADTVAGGVNVVKILGDATTYYQEAVFTPGTTVSINIYAKGSALGGATAAVLCMETGLRLNAAGAWGTSTDVYLNNPAPGSAWTNNLKVVTLPDSTECPGGVCTLRFFVTNVNTVLNVDSAAYFKMFAVPQWDVCAAFGHTMQTQGGTFMLRASSTGAFAGELVTVAQLPAAPRVISPHATWIQAAAKRSERWVQIQLGYGSQANVRLSEVWLGQAIKLLHSPTWGVTWTAYAPAQIRSSTPGGMSYPYQPANAIPMREYGMAFHNETLAQWEQVYGRVFKGSRMGVDPMLLIPDVVETDTAIFGTCEPMVTMARPNIHRWNINSFKVRELPLYYGPR